MRLETELATSQRANEEALHRLKVAAKRISLQTKAKIVISFYSIVTQLSRVYALIYPPAYTRLMESIGSAFYIVVAWVPAVSSACTGLGLEHEVCTQHPVDAVVRSTRTDRAPCFRSC